MKTIPFFEYPRLWTDNKAQWLSIFDQVASSGGFIMQQATHDFEQKLADYVGSAHAVGVGNATDGMEIFLAAIGLRSGDEIIISSHTMLATASAVIMAGGVPVPVEIGDDNLIDPEAIENAITPNTVGIMPTQLNGRVCRMDKIQSVAEKKGLFIVEDAAQALGAKYKGKCAGTFGLASGISFFPAKVLGAFGDAGGALTDDAALYHKIYQLHDHGRDLDGEVKCWGRNSRLDNLHAAILNHKFETYADDVARRRAIAGMYQERLGGLEHLKLPPGPDSHPDHFDVFQNYELEAERRDDLRAFLKDNGIGTLIQWGGQAVHQFRQLGFTQSLPKTEHFFRHCIMLPMNVFLSDSDVEYICETVHRFYR